MESLAVKYRPKTLEETVGQASILKILKRQLEEDKVRNVYLFAGASGCGKAQPLTSHVLTPTGYTKMGNIKEGDTILDGKGAPCIVEKVFPQGERDIYRINFSDGTFIEVSDNHLNSIYINNTDKNKREDYVVSTLELIQMLKSSKFNIRVDLPLIDCWRDNSLNIDPYLLGALIGDGSLSNNFGFSNSEKDVVQKVSLLLEQGWGMFLKKVPGDNVDYSIVFKNSNKQKYIFTYKGNEYKGVESLREALVLTGYPKFDSETLIRMAKKNKSSMYKHYPELNNAIKVVEDINYHCWTDGCPLKEELQRLGLMCKSIDKHIPKQYLMSSFESRLSLLQGLMDTDGYMSAPQSGKTGCSYEFTTSSKQLAEDVEFLMRSLGIQVRVTCKPAHYVNAEGQKISANDSYSFSIHPNNELRIVSSAKHLAKWWPKQQPAIRKIVSIEFNRRDKCQCIYVSSPEHTYITDNFTITHNTTVARSFANAINRGQGSPIEIDAASNNGVDNVRELVGSAQERSIDSKYKIYIFDECHSFTSQSWQAFLKCVEEPPTYTIFIFCTTDPQKIPVTILNRVQRFNFTRIKHELIKDRLKYVCDCEGFTNYEEGIDYISKISAGCLRDALTCLDKCSAYSKEISIDNVLYSLGNYSYDTFFKLINSIIDSREADVLTQLSEIYDSGADMKIFVDQFLSFCLDISKYIVTKNCSILTIPTVQENNIKNCINFDSADKYYAYIIDGLVNLKTALKNDINGKETTEIALLKLARCK